MIRPSADAARWESAGAVLSEASPRWFQKLLELAERAALAATDPLHPSLRDALLEGLDFGDDKTPC